MNRLWYFSLFFITTLFAAEPIVSDKAEFVYPDFSQCYEKNRQSVVYFGKTRAIAVSEKQAIAFSKEKPTVPFSKHDPFLNLYLFDSPKALIPIKLKSTSELKLGEWVVSMTEDSLLAVNASKIGKNINDFFEHSGKGDVNSIVGGLCCEMYGLGIGDKYYISSEALQNFISSKSIVYKEFGVRFSENNSTIMIDFVDPMHTDLKVKVGDKVLALNGKKVENLNDLQSILQNQSNTPKIVAQLQRGNLTIEENLISLKPKRAEVKKTPLPEVKKESSSTLHGLKFDAELKLIEIPRNSFAEISGLKVGDKLLQIDQISLQKIQDVDRYLTKNKNKEMSLLFDRNNFQFFVTLKN